MILPGPGGFIVGEELVKRAEKILARRGEPFGVSVLFEDLGEPLRVDGLFVGRGEPGN